MSIEVMKQALKAMEAAIKAGDWIVDGACDPDMALVALRQAIEQAEQKEPVAAAWDEGYRQGIQDERTSEANIGIAGFNAKVEPARQNPYGSCPPQHQPLTT